MFLTGQIEVSLLPLLAKEMEGGGTGRGRMQGGAGARKEKIRTCRGAGSRHAAFKLSVFMLWLKE